MRPRVVDGELQIDAIDGDLYNGTDTAKNVLLQPAPQAGKWEAVDQGQARPGGSYEQGGLVLYKDAKNFLKLMLMDTEGNGFRLEFGQDVNGVTTNVDSRDRSGALPAGINDTGVWLKMSQRRHERLGRVVDGRHHVDGVQRRQAAGVAGRGQDRPRRLPRQRPAGAVRLLPSRKRQPSPR